MGELNLEDAVPLSSEVISPAENVIYPNTLIWIKENFKSKSFVHLNY